MQEKQGFMLQVQGEVIDKEFKEDCGRIEEEIAKM